MPLLWNISLRKGFPFVTDQPPQDTIGNHTRRPMRPGKALAVSLLLPCLLYGSVVLLAGDRLFVFSKTPPGRESRAALAIRDDVIPFFKWGTLLFTRQYLRKHYAESWYFTQASKGDCREEFASALKQALENYPAVDLYLLAHTNHYIRWVKDLPEELRSRIRFVYNTGCHNQPQGKDWLALGADAYIGHPGVSESPFFYFFLLRHWLHGATLEEALALGNDGMHLKFRQLEWTTFGRFQAEALMKESRASVVGDVGLRLGDTAP